MKGARAFYEGVFWAGAHEGAHDGRGALGRVRHWGRDAVDWSDAADDAATGSGYLSDGVAHHPMRISKISAG